MTDTKSKILEESKILFFQQGIANTRLQQIADATGISVGNLAYHFKNKESIVEAVYENLFVDLSTILSKFILFDTLEGFDKQFSDLYYFFEQNSFTFNNIWEIERNHPDIQKEWLKAMNKLLLQIKKRIDHCTQAGILKTENNKGDYELLAQNLLLIINSWIPQQMLRKKQVSEALYKKSIWSLIYPLLTSKGKSAFLQNIVPNQFM